MPHCLLTLGQKPTFGNDQFVPSQEELDFESWLLKFLSQALSYHSLYSIIGKKLQRVKKKFFLTSK